MSKLRVTFTEKFALENYGVVTYHGVMIPLYGLIDKLIEIFYIEVVPEDVKMFYELKFKNKLTIDQKLRLIAETYEGRRRIKEFSSFGTNASFAEKQLKFVPDWYIFANGPITKYILGNNAYSEFYYEPLTEDDKWVRYFGIISKSVPLITSLFNRTSAVMARLITGNPLPPTTPPVRGSGRNLPPPRPPRGPPPGPPPVIAGPPAILGSGRNLPPPRPPRGPPPGPPAIVPPLPLLRLGVNLPPPRPPRPPPPGPPAKVPPLPPLGFGRYRRKLTSTPESPVHTVDAGEISSPLIIREPLPDTVKSPIFAEVRSLLTEFEKAVTELDSSLSHIAPGLNDKISATADITLDKSVSESQYETTQEEIDVEDSESQYETTQEEIDVEGSEHGSEHGSEDGSEDGSEVKSKPAIIDPESEDYAPDYSKKITFESPPDYETLEPTVLELLPTPKTIQTFMSNIFQIQYQATLNQLKTMAKDPTIKRYIPEGTLKSSMNKAAHVKVILKAYTDLVSNQGYDYDEVKEEKVLYNSVSYILENFGSLKETKKSDIEKIKTDYINSLKSDPEHLKNLLKDLDTVNTMRKIGTIEGPKLASAFLRNYAIEFPPLDSSRNIATVLSLLSYASIDATKTIMRKYGKEISNANKDEIAAAVREYFTNLNIPDTQQFISLFKFKHAPSFKYYASLAK